MKTKIVLMIVILALSALTKKTIAVNSNSEIKDGVAYYLQTDKFVYNLEEDVEMLYRVTNLTENTVDIGEVVDGEPSWYHFAITDDGNNEIWHYPWYIPLCPPEILSLEPYQSIEYQIVWNMMNDNGTSYEYDDYPVGPGIYDIMGELNLYSGERVPIFVAIEAIPEPATIALLGVGFIGTILNKRKRGKR